MQLLLPQSLLLIVTCCVFFTILEFFIVAMVNRCLTFILEHPATIHLIPLYAFHTFDMFLALQVLTV